MKEYVARQFEQLLASLPVFPGRPWVTCARCGTRVQWHLDSHCSPCAAIVAGVAILAANGGMQQSAEQLVERLQQAGWYLSCAEEWS